MSRTGLPTTGARNVFRNESRTFNAAVPDRSDARAEWLAGMLVFALALVNIIGQLGVAIFIVITGLMLVNQPRFCLRQIAIFSPLLLIPVLGATSAMWSDAPQRTMRAALQLALTIGATIVVCRSLRPQYFILALFAGFLVTALTVLPAVPSSLANHYALNSFWGSKNSVGYAGYILAALALAIVVDRQRSWPVRILALAAIGYGLVVAVLAQSGGTTSAIVITLAIFPAAAMLGAFRPRNRAAIGAAAALATVVALVFLDRIQEAITDFRVNVLNKDATLTGRTYLWDFAERLSAAHPTWGIGYYSFWRQGNIDAEGLWRWGGIADRGGFNFHNAFIEMRVDLGLVGLSILIATCVVVLSVALVRQFVRPSASLACLIGITVVTYVRSYVEDGIVAPFSLVMVMWFATLLYAVPATRRAVDTGARGQAIVGRLSGRRLRTPTWVGSARLKGLTGRTG